MMKVLFQPFALCNTYSAMWSIKSWHRVITFLSFGRINSENGDRQTNERLEADANTPGLHISTFIRQTAFDILYFVEFIILLGFGFSAQIVRDGYLHNYTYNFIWIVSTMTIFSLLLKFFYYNVLHIWSNTIFTSTRIKSQPFEFMGSSKSYITENGEHQSRFKNNL